MIVRIRRWVIALVAEVLETLQGEYAMVENPRIRDQVDHWNSLDVMLCTMIFVVNRID